MHYCGSKLFLYCFNVVLYVLECTITCIYMSYNYVVVTDLHIINNYCSGLFQERGLEMRLVEVSSYSLIYNNVMYVSVNNYFLHEHIHARGTKS